MVLHHHERVDGKGYPYALSEDEIPLGARILAVSDAYDAMTTDRSYRNKMSLENAKQQLKQNMGTQFDRKVVNAFLSTLKS